MPPFRVGIGYDIHRFSGVPTEGQYITLCGVKVEYSRGVDAHSDGDVAIHALVDAILGCVGEKSIGELFQNTDPRWHNADSSQFLIEAQKRAALKGYAISNFDISIVCEEPKIMPHVTKMKAFLADVLTLDIAAASIKAVTAERLGSIGRKEGIAAHAVILCYHMK